MSSPNTSAATAAVLFELLNMEDEWGPGPEFDEGVLLSTYSKKSLELERVARSSSNSTALNIYTIVSIILLFLTISLTSVCRGFTRICLHAQFVLEVKFHFSPQTMATKRVSYARIIFLQPMMHLNTTSTPWY
jgi:hypothetical protein